MNKLRIVFMGTPDFAVNVLQGLIDNYNVVLVVSQPDKEVGRHHEKRFTPVKELAVKENIEVFQPLKIREDYEKIVDLKPDMIVTCAYGQFIPKELLELPKYGCINVHASLLPKLRGGAPIHHALIDNYPRTGVTIMYMVEKMDAGDIISQKDTIIKNSDNVGTLHDRLSEMGTKLLLDTIPNIVSGNINPIKQDENEVTFGFNIKREEEHIDFSDYAINVFNRIRGLNPYPGGYAILDGKNIKLYSSYITDRFYTEKEDGEISAIYEDGFGVSVKDREVVITEFQIEGKKRMKVKDYFNGIDKNSLLGKIFK